MRAAKKPILAIGVVALGVCAAVAGQQDRAGPAAPDQGADRRVGGWCSPGQAERVPELVVGVLGPDVAQLLVGCAPVGQVTTRWQPGQNGHQGGAVVAGQVLGVAQRPEAGR